MEHSTTRQSSGDTVAVPRAVKNRLFGDETSDHLHKQVLKARLLRQLQQPTGGLDTHEEGEGATEPSAHTYEVEPVRIGRYTILRKLGQGGMGVVYVAFDEDLDRKVAIKLLRGELSKDDRGRARMLREAQALARLSHPNVVQVHEVGQWNEHDFVAMEFIDGQTFDRWTDAKPRSWQEVLEVMTQAGRGLEAAHTADLVHRDFKPANLLLGHDGRARVVDFGLARAITERSIDPEKPAPPKLVEAIETAEHAIQSLSASEDELSDNTIGSSAFDKLLTVTGAVLGTPAYMAPEQHLGDPATALSDQFSFCVVLYEALYGRRPFKGANRTEYAVRVTEGDYQAPPTNSGVPTWLRRVVMRGLDPVPANRWPSMASLLAELGRDRTRTGRRVVIAVGLLAAVGVALAFNGGEPEVCEDNRRSIEDTWGDEQRDAMRAAFGTIEMPEADTVLAQTERSLNEYAQGLVAARAEACEARWQERSQTDAQLELRNACLEQRERELGAVVGVLAEADRDVVLHAPELVAGLGEIGLCARVELLEAGTAVPKDAASVEAIAEVRRTIAQAHAARDVGRFDDAKGLTAEAWVAAEELEFEPLVGELHNLEAANALVERKYAEARTHLIAAVGIAQRHQTLELGADAWLNLAFLEARTGVDPDQSLEFELATIAVAQLGSPPRYEALLAYARGFALRESGQAAQSLPAFDRALELAEAGFVGSAHMLSKALAARSDALASLGRAEEARADLDRVVSARGSRSRLQLDALFSLAVEELNNGELDDGERDMKAALRGYEDLFGPRFESIAHGKLALGRTALQRGTLDTAERAFEEALAILDENHADHDWALDALAAAQVSREDYDGAERTLRKAISHRRHTNNSDEARLAYLHGRLATVLSDGGRYDSAIVEFDHVVVLLDQPHIETPLDLAEVLLGRGEAWLAQGQASLALDSLERAVDLAPIDCGVAWLAGEARVALASALNQLGIRRVEQVELARAGVELLSDIPGSEDALARAQELSDPDTPKKPSPSHERTQR